MCPGAGQVAGLRCPGAGQVSVREPDTIQSENQSKNHQPQQQQPLTANRFWLVEWYQWTGKRPDAQYTLATLSTLERKFGRKWMVEECRGGKETQGRVDLDLLRKRLEARRDGDAWRGSPAHEQKKPAEEKAHATVEELRARGELP